MIQMARKDSVFSKPTMTLAIYTADTSDIVRDG